MNDQQREKVRQAALEGKRRYEEIRRQCDLIRSDLDYDNSSGDLQVKYMVRLRWIGGFDRVVASELSPQQARDLYSVLALSWTPLGEDCPLNSDFYVVVERFDISQHIGSIVTDGMLHLSI